ncbi:divergent polysaccharide deacetylase family protein [Fuscibacter oryzae]|uniref:Divergent polysaccharide deacetylase family protein n=1 Tax=Fuscibacter oryzae TaxID=2803939 RepID=A0A8J7STI9_9RHOB|nr:divergent polysaccharide deacetylase family protein [Fuscibacter oryzae]MBL4928595.1 divergent polysaccharide deacetylase family protein [Fuscibacter oryzae]
MIRDMVAGVLCGGIVSAVGLGIVSQVTSGPQAGEQPVIASEMAPAAPKPAEPEGGVETAASKPAEVNLAVPDAAAPDSAPLENTSPEAVTAEPAKPAPSISADPSPVPPEVTLEEVPQAGATPAAPGKVTSPAPDSLAPSLPAATVTPKVQPGDAAPAAVAQAPASQPATTAPASPVAPAEPAAAPTPSAELPAPASTAIPGQPTDRLLEPGAEPAPAPAPADVAPMPEVAPEPATEAAAAAEKPKMLQPDSATKLDPAPGLPKAADGVTVGRLPTIGAAPDTADTKDAAQPASPVPEDLPPIKRYAAAFENPSGKPLFALVLTDDGSPELDRARLAALPFPVTFAVNPLAPNAPEAAATYRAGGKEVVMLVSGLPSGAQASDVEQSFQAMSAALPESVAVIDLAASGFQDDRALATQIVTILKADGRGLITYDRGLNAADQVARRDALPATMVFRDLDGQGEEVPMIRRYLDRAAFKAAQEGRVTVVGTTRPETVAAIMEWTVEGRASSVTLAPATAVMVTQ